MRRVSFYIFVILFSSACSEFMPPKGQETSPTLKVQLIPLNTPGNICNSNTPGVFPDVHYFNGSLWCAVQSSGQLRVIEMNVSDFAIRSSRDFPLQPGSLIFNRLSSANGHLFVAYRDGNNAILRNLSTGFVETLGPSGGNDPVAVENGFVAWQDMSANFTIFRKSLSGGAVSSVGPGRPTGLSRILPNGTVTLIDDDRFAIFGHTRPCWAGNYVAVENNDGGVMVRRISDGVQVLAWAGLITFTPKCTVYPEGVVVTTWGENWVRTMAIRNSDFGSTAPTPTPPPTPVPSGCTTVKPGADWVCVNGGWLPPGHPGIPGTAPTPTPAPIPNNCPTIKPGPTWICVNGGWVPPDHPLAIGH